MGLQYNIVANEEGEKNVTYFRQGDKPLVAASTHPNFEEIVKRLIADDTTVADLFDIALSAGTKLQRLTERITSAHGWLYLDGERMENGLVDQVIAFLNEGIDDWKPIVAFLENVEMNPSTESREELYNWIAEDKLTLTDDGMIVGYKGVKVDATHGYKSSSTGTAICNGEVFEGNIPNPLGAIVEMPRSEVLHNPHQDCAVGLHVGTWGYASTFSDKTLEVHVHPRDVVSVPSYDHNKMRVCRYKVVKELSKRYDTPVKKTEPVKEPAPTKVEARGSNSKKVANAVKGIFKGDTEVRVGDVYEDRDKRRAGRQVRVTKVESDIATVVPCAGWDKHKKQKRNVVGGKETTIAVNRLASRAYKRVRRGKNAQ